MIRITIALLVCGIALAAPTPAAATDAAPSPSAPVVTFVGTASVDERAMVAWAADRFAAAGLQLPDVTVSFPVVCRSEDGRPLAGRYLVGRREIELCCPSRRLALHELAHAWDDASGIDRSALLAELELEHWYAQPGRPSTDSGGEQLALIVTWGLMDVDLAHPAPAWAGQPLAQQPRSLPQLPGRTTADLARLFQRITGLTPLSPSAVTAAEADRFCSASWVPLVEASGVRQVRGRADQHLAFGFGIHRCMGSRLAEMQLRILWEEILQRFERIEVVDEPKRTLSSFVHGYTELPVRVTRA